ncbi:MAG: hypothetical protein PHP45_00090 [Elusimicrobiales bacterium]|nr:hypothetical protein [Elusimicrobiales bacterium]
MDKSALQKYLAELVNEGDIDCAAKLSVFLKVLGNFRIPNRIRLLQCFIEVGKVLTRKSQLSSGIRRKMASHLRHKKALTGLRACSHFFVPNLLRPFSSRFSLSTALSGLTSRQNRLQKPQLKPKEIRAAVGLIMFHYAKTSVIELKIKPELAVCLGRDMTEEQAKNYYRDNVQGQVRDAYGRQININADGVRHLYKDEDGKHTICAEYLMQSRVKRLPWIRYALENTMEIYKRYDGDWICYAYTQTFSVPFRTGGENNYLMVIVRSENAQAPLKFVTAYYINDHEELLKRIEEFEPFETSPVIHKTF